MYNFLKQEIASTEFDYSKIVTQRGQKGHLTQELQRIPLH